MSFVRLDAVFFDRPGVAAGVRHLGESPRAHARLLAVYFEAAAYVARHRTGGFIPQAAARRFVSDRLPLDVLDVMAFADVGLVTKLATGYHLCAGEAKPAEVPRGPVSSHISRTELEKKLPSFPQAAAPRVLTGTEARDLHNSSTGKGQNNSEKSQKKVGTLAGRSAPNAEASDESVRSRTSEIAPPSRVDPVVTYPLDTTEKKYTTAAAPTFRSIFGRLLGQTLRHLEREPGMRDADLSEHLKRAAAKMGAPYDASGISAVIGIARRRKGRA